ncbi:hypothetical protein QJS04_geneDACA016267 [Acorus gramineus]|uniref:Uncharacterized protein n=1 Tax=Acorus gramineus TaxID=55184 RepID=A0AAV9AIF4_ACOGR|nr:hypothetical protein QJS04_geneDACA016267 [Acorus gramineus]
MSRLQSIVKTMLPALGNIRDLVLNNCSIAWKEVEVLKESLPKVEELHLMANRLSEITPAPPSSDATYVKGFTSLRLLNLEDNCIHAWDEDIWLSENPVVTPEKGGIPRFVQVACLSKAQILNGSEMQSENAKEVDQHHPRFMELKELHGIDHEGPSTGSAGLQKMSSGLLCKVREINQVEVVSSRGDHHGNGLHGEGEGCSPTSPMGDLHHG